MALDGMDVVVLAGGFGSRIRPVLGDTPKILAPIHGRPFLHHLLERLAARGAGRVILSLGIFADKVYEQLAAMTPPLPVVTVTEPSPLGTGGALRLAAPQIKTDPALVMNGDTWLETDYGDFISSHKASGCTCSILCVRTEDASRYGRIDIGKNGMIERFSEKIGMPQPGIISGGVYLFTRSTLDKLAKMRGPSLERDFLEKYAAANDLHGYIADDAVFVDIGTPESLREAEKIVAAKGR